MKKGAELLIEKYSSDEKVYNCGKKAGKIYEKVIYSKWQIALRGYNGWNIPCFDIEGNKIGEPLYVDKVLAQKDKIKELFPSVCSS